MVIHEVFLLTYSTLVIICRDAFVCSQNVLRWYICPRINNINNGGCDSSTSQRMDSYNTTLHADGNLSVASSSYHLLCYHVETVIQGMFILYEAENLNIAHNEPLFKTGVALASNQYRIKTSGAAIPLFTDFGI